MDGSKPQILWDSCLPLNSLIPFASKPDVTDKSSAMTAVVLIHYFPALLPLYPCADICFRPECCLAGQPHTFACSLAEQWSYFLETAVEQILLQALKSNSLNWKYMDKINVWHG